MAGLSLHKGWARAGAALLSVSLLLAPAAGVIGASDSKAKAAGPAASGWARQTAIKANSYAAYIEPHSNAPMPEREIVIEASSYSSAIGGDFAIKDNLEGMSGASLLTGESGTVQWTVDIPEEGLYQLALTYFPTEGKSSAIERELRIDGSLPFSEAQYLQFDRVWANEKDEVERDNQDNDLRPRQKEQPRWMEQPFEDPSGYEQEPYRFYFSKGVHKLSLTSGREPMAIRSLKLYQAPKPPSYEEAKAAYREGEGTGQPADVLLRVEGESAAGKSSPTLYPMTERSSPAVKPYSASKIRVNTIGGYNWRLPGEWIEWEVEVPETGLYQIAFKSQQNFVKGIYATRKLTIDGKVPFAEMETVPFRYKSGYRLDVMGGEDPYLFRLEQGKHVIRLQAVLGDFAPLIQSVEDSLYNLNAMYRQILMITGTKPDEFRDYRIERQIPNLLDVFGAESKRLKGIASELRKLSGQSSDQEALLNTMSRQLDEMIASPETIPRRLNAYKTNTGGLGTWVQQAREQPLEIDALYVASPGRRIPDTGSGFWPKLKHEAGTFMSSFFTDYNNIGNVSDGKQNRTVTVWIGSGRDQANTMKAMIDESFTPGSGISVNLKLVNMGTLLPATLSGEGPDVAMQIGNDLPVNFAMRRSAVDLTGFPDFEAAAKEFRDSAIVPYRYESGVYALPETQTFNMLFYRKDVLQELGLEVPQTWDDVQDLLSILSKNHMEFGLPVVAQANMQGVNIPPNSQYSTLLLQNGGSFYRDGGRQSDLDSRVGIETFKQWTEFYTDYKLEREYDFANRFRTGQMPIGITDYTMYNQLSVFAPEIRGQWGFVPVPGTLQQDGSIRRDTPASGSGVMMLREARDKDAAWQFMKWWTSAGIQAEFGREMEGLMGAAARYPTANIAALDSLPWPAQDYASLKEQFAEVRGVPEVPGGYFTGRHLFNAFYQTVVGGVEARESMMDYTEYIQDEIRTKRKEFGLP